MPITSFYAALLAFLFLFLSARVIRARRTEKISIGSGDAAMLLRAIRVQGNFSEYVPLAIILMALAEISTQPAIAIHLAGLMVLAGRCIHAFGVSREPEDFRFRVTGMALTLTAIGCAAALNLIAAVMIVF